MKKILFLVSAVMATSLCNAKAYKITTSDHVDLYINVQGKGAPCLYIHGGPGSGSYWMEKFAGDILEKRFTMVYLDLRGVGRSTSPGDSNYGIDRMIQDFEEIRQFLGFKDWTIMGHSFSGTMTTAYALEHPKSIRSILMFNCSLDLKESITESWIPKAVEILDIKDSLFYQDTTVAVQDKLNRLFPLLNEKGVMWKLAYADKENETKMNATYREIPNWNHDFSAVGMVHKDYLINFKTFTSVIETPVLFFYGENDWTIGPEHYKGVLFPNMVLWKSSSGHIPFMENKNDLEAAMDLFLKKYDLNQP